MGVCNKFLEAAHKQLCQGARNWNGEGALLVLTVSGRARKSGSYRTSYVIKRVRVDTVGRTVARSLGDGLELRG